MNAKLTLRLDDKLVVRAKRYSSKSGKSVSRLVADYFALIGSTSIESPEELTPRVRDLFGSLEGASIDEKDYRVYLTKKYQ